MEYINEEFKLITDYENYSISSYGRVRNDTTGLILKAGNDGHGYNYVVLYNDNNKKKMTVHKLVANAFIDNPDNKPCIDHIDNDKLNNKVTNLRYATHIENNQNRSMRKDNTSGIKGVTFIKRYNKWQAQIKINGKNIYLGSFDNKDEAIKARLIKSMEIHGKFINQCEIIELKRIELNQELNELELLEKEFQELIK